MRRDRSHQIGTGHTRPDEDLYEVRLYCFMHGTLLHVIASSRSFPEFRNIIAKCIFLKCCVILTTEQFYFTLYHTFFGVLKLPLYTILQRTVVFQSSRCTLHPRIIIFIIIFFSGGGGCISFKCSLIKIRSFDLLPLIATLREQTKGSNFN